MSITPLHANPYKAADLLHAASTSFLYSMLLNLSESVRTRLSLQDLPSMGENFDPESETLYLEWVDWARLTWSNYKWIQLFGQRVFYIASVRYGWNKRPSTGLWYSEEMYHKFDHSCSGIDEDWFNNEETELTPFPVSDMLMKEHGKEGKALTLQESIQIYREEYSRTQGVLRSEGELPFEEKLRLIGE